jgi:hypothetical protein
MQSPFLNSANPTSPYGAMAQMFLTSPPSHPPSGSLPDASTSQSDRPSFSRRFSHTNVVSGVLTPGVFTPRRLRTTADFTTGPSGDIHPEVRMGLMSPMQLEMLARGEMIEGMDNVRTRSLRPRDLQSRILDSVLTTKC